MLGRLATIAAVALLAACGDKQAAQPAAQPAAPASAPAMSAPDPLSVRPTGVGPIGDGTPFDAELIARAFPGATVERGFMHFGGKERVPIMSVLADGTQTLQIVGDAAGSVGEVTVTGGAFVAPGGEKLMTRWSETRFAVDDCVMGDGPSLHALVCRKPDAPEIQYVFGIPGWGSSETPSADVLAEKAFLREFIWTAHTPAP